MNLTLQILLAVFQSLVVLGIAVLIARMILGRWLIGRDLIRASFVAGAMFALGGLGGSYDASTPIEVVFVASIEIVAVLFGAVYFAKLSLHRYESEEQS
ncbi:hypothetical protein WJT74_03560 [Sphingomicrobium sp. XHP0239]|uniref:hypothetical protein n=1 Tax=Sphingomicrobium maritimum TaxID=3133972 RepID=UPI0031CC63E3